MKDTYGSVILFPKYMNMYEHFHNKYIKQNVLNGKVNTYHVLMKNS